MTNLLIVYRDGTERTMIVNNDEMEDVIESLSNQPNSGILYIAKKRDLSRL